MKSKYIYSALALTVIFIACEPSFDNEISENTYSRGDADFSTYVAVGNSLTAGFMDGAIFKTGQSVSFPNILSKQFAAVGGGKFTQPSYDDDVNNLGGLLVGGKPVAPTRIIINTSLDENNNPIGPQNIKGTPSIEVSKLQAKAYNNMGIPGAKVFHLLSKDYGNISGLVNGTANPYFVRQATSPTTSVLEDAISLKPTFFTNWIGNNDVLSYASSGGVGVYQKGNTNVMEYGSNDITDPTLFAATYKQIVESLTANNAKGVLITIPDVTLIPFFTTIPFNPIPPDAFAGKEDEFNQLNGFLEKFKKMLVLLGQGERLKTLSTKTANPLLIRDKDLIDISSIIEVALIATGVNPSEALYIGNTFGQARHTTDKDLILLSAKAAIGTDAPAGKSTFKIYGITYPLDDQYVLTEVEQQNVKEATIAYNETIKTIAQEKNLALADMNDIMFKLVSGIRVDDGQIYTADYFKGVSHLNTVMFSLDGVHPNGRGYAFIANEIIRTINMYYKSKIPIVNIGEYSGPTLLSSN